MRDVGTMGQQFFAVWCSSIGLTGNGSQIDRTGWDFFVEFPWINNQSTPKDMLPSPIECKVQVKATDGRDRKVSITISKLNRMIKAQMPAFFCLIEFEGKNEPQSAFLKHVDKSIIERTLKRIRELDVSGEGNRLNKREISIDFDEGERLERPFEESLKKAIEGYIPDGMEKDIEGKNQLLKTLGFENGSYRLTLTVAGENPIENMIDATLGMREKVDVERFTVYHTRFGILSNKPSIAVEKGILSFGQIKPLSKATVRFKEYDFSPSISFEASLYVSPLTPSIPEKFVKFRIESEFFQIVIEPFNKTMKYSYSLTGQGRTSLRKLRDFLKVLTLFKKSASGIILEIEPESFVPMSGKITVTQDLG